MPQCTPAAEKPFGAQMPPGIDLKSDIVCTPLAILYRTSKAFPFGGRWPQAG
jgi:hypothetical protein